MLPIKSHWPGRTIIGHWGGNEDDDDIGSGDDDKTIFTISREDVEGVPFLLEDIRSSLLTFKKVDSSFFHSFYKEVKKEEEEDKEEVDILDRLSHVANPYDPLLVLSIIRPDLFELKRHGKRQQHTSVGNFKEAPGVIDPSKVRAVLKQYLNKHF